MTKPDSHEPMNGSLGNQMPDDMWERIYLIPDIEIFDDFKDEVAHDNIWTWCQDDVGDDLHPSVPYIREDLSIPRKDVEGLIKKLEYWRQSNIAVEEVINQLQALLNNNQVKKENNK